MTHELPNRFDHTEACQPIYDAWQQAGCFDADPDPNKKPFAIVIPPPNVTGALHLGHGLNNTLQDVLVRMRRMQGYAALWMPGTDHAGIATQAVVERRLKELENKTRHDLGREELVARIWKWKDQYETRILGQLKRMGCSCDWRRTRFTLDDTCAAAVRATFFDLFGKQLIYRGKKLVNWDTFLQTAVSDDEVFHETKQGHFWHYQYPVIDPQPGEPTSVTIATTRPETMLGDTAVAVHPDPAHQLDKIEAELQEKLAAASDKERPDVEAQIKALAERRKTHLPLLIQLRDMAAAGRKLRLPLLGREIPLVADQWAKPELGSGCVKITPAHDPNDYEVGQRQDLPMINILNSDGTMNAEAGPYEGLTIKQARNKIVADLEEAGLMVKIEDREIELGLSDRSKTAIEPYLADQWFVKMDTLAQSAMDAVSDERVQIFPPRYRKGYLDWLGEKRDWPVSRQLWWGHRIPIWSLACGSADEAAAISEKLASIAAASDGKLVHQTAEDHSVHVCIEAEDAEIEQQVESLGLVQDPDVLDTWFSSALWPHSTLGWPEQTGELKYFYPTSTLITSRDIITLWVARMVLMGLNNIGEIPFREVFIHPKIMDGNGETMSKSKGNGVDPNDVIDKFGPDSLRFGLAWIAAETQDVRMPVQFECPHCEKLNDQTKKNRQLPRIACKHCKKEFSTQWAEAEADIALPKAAVVSERFEQARNFTNKLWNAARFAMLNLEDTPTTPLDVQTLETEDRWILSRLASVTAQVTEALEHYRYADAARALYDFAWDEFCSFYVEMAKPRLNDPAQAGPTKQVLAHTLDTLLRLLHPIMPFVTESIWQHLGQIAPTRGLADPQPAAKWLMQAEWPVADESQIDTVIEERFATFQAALGAIREIRSRQGITRDTVPFAIRCTPSTAELLQPMTTYFTALAHADATAFGPDVTAPQTSAHVALPQIDIDVFVDLEKFIDVDAELERNGKLLENLIKQISGKQNKLANESFVDRAPAEVVQKERQSLGELKQQRTAVEQAIKDLQSRKA
ncbi:valine--tRNA ligase [Rosistilla oblonga]|uniref:valine--tRNA ligase n=1 Tax=Rosistilla oblonga TaxID=2527990 RepID=UPI003A970820